MKNGYIIALREVNDGIISQVLCLDYKEVVTLMNNLDESYQLLNITVVENISTNYQDYCEKENNLEKGKDII